MKLPGETVDLKRRSDAVDNAIALLRSQRSLPPLSISTGMSSANRDHVTDQGGSGKNFGHTGDKSSGSAARLRRYGTVGCAYNDEDEYENIIYFKPSTARGEISISQMIVLEMLINYKSRRTGISTNMLSPDFQVTGVACGSHSGFLGEMCVTTYAEGYVEKS